MFLFDGEWVGTGLGMGLKQHVAFEACLCFNPLGFQGNIIRIVTHMSDGNHQHYIIRTHRSPPSLLMAKTRHNYTKSVHASPKS